jgi:pimeloyl-ACP methyl ester carboxylesterase
MTLNAPRFLPVAPQLVVLHCSASSPGQWEPYRPMIEPATRWIAPPLQGYESESPWPLGAPTTLAAEARRVLPILARSGGVVDLVGHSYGGAVALQVASAWPERIRSVTVYEPVLFHLLQEDTQSAARASEVRCVAADIASRLHAGDGEGAGKRFVDYWSGPGTWSRIGLRMRAALALRMSKVNAEFGALFAATTEFAGLAEGGPQVRLVAGTDSPAPVHRIMKRLQDLLPHAATTEVRGAGHMAPVHNPGTLAPLLFPEHVQLLALAA